MLLTTLCLQRLPDLYKHMMAVSFQMAVALEAAGAAAALNRTLIYPRFYCWCDFDWYAVVLDGCAMGGRPGKHGADLFVKPFECPIDVIFNPHHLYHRGAPYRQARWLDSPRLPAAVARSREPVLVLDHRDDAALFARERMVRRCSACCHTVRCHIGSTRVCYAKLKQRPAVPCDSAFETRVRCCQVSGACK